MEEQIILGKISEMITNMVQIQDQGECLFFTEDNRKISDKAWQDWNWSQGVALYGLYKYAKNTNNTKAYQEIQDWFENYRGQDIQEKQVNAMAPILTLAYLYEECGDPEMLRQIKEWGSWAMDSLPKTKFSGFQHTVFVAENPGQLWDDTLMMAALAMAKIGIILNRQEYIDEAQRQFLVHAQFLMDRKTGLWFHGWTFNEKHNFGKALWGRGNCWITIAIPELFEILGDRITGSVRLFLQDVLQYQIEALTEYQSSEGLWHTIITDKKSYVEISATLGFAYGILKACHMKLISQDYLSIGKAAVIGSLPYIKNGHVTNVSAGTGMGDNLDFYRRIPLDDMPYGPALAILALNEYLPKMSTVPAT